MASERWDALGKVALALCLVGMVVGIGIGVLAVAYPRTWTMRDAGNTLIAAEVFAAFVGVLARKSAYGSSAIVIGGILALGAWVFTP
jgi:hypothetical protein